MANSTDRPQRVLRSDLTLWARMAREAEQAARTEDAPTAFGIVSALASYLDQALTVCAHRWVTSMCWKPVCANCGDTGPRQLKLAKPTGEQIWDDDYRATHGDGLEESRAAADELLEIEPDGDDLEESTRPGDGLEPALRRIFGR